MFPLDDTRTMKMAALFFSSLAIIPDNRHKEANEVFQLDRFALSASYMISLLYEVIIYRDLDLDTAIRDYHDCMNLFNHNFSGLADYERPDIRALGELGLKMNNTYLELLLMKKKMGAAHKNLDYLNLF